jgi:polyhydroxyalkanoate synthesis regulator protein
MNIRVIKYYNNRKLYDTRTSSYVNLTDLIEFMRNSYDIQVIRKDGTDCTTTIKARMVELIQGTKVELLNEIIRKGN